MATWVPESERTLKWKIWNEKFYVSVPNLETRSSDHIRAYGTPTSGDAQRDRIAAKERLETMLSIRQMVLYHHQGILVALKRRRDSKTIYDMLMEYLGQWKAHIASSLLTKVDAPYEDLIAMERFLASAVFPHAAEFRPTTPTVSESWLSKQVGSLNQGIKLNIEPPPQSSAEPLQPGEAPPQPKETAVERLFSNRGKRWG